MTMPKSDKKVKLLPCPFCGGVVEEHFDNCGGSCIEHKKKHRDGRIDDCILTSVQLNNSSRFMIGEWNRRTPCQR